MGFIIADWSGIHTRVALAALNSDGSWNEHLYTWCTVDLDQSIDATIHATSSGGTIKNYSLDGKVSS